jgi:hypothetical protein
MSGAHGNFVSVGMEGEPTASPRVVAAEIDPELDIARRKPG